MVITWYGQACFKIQSGELVIAIDPFQKEIGLTPPRFRADIVLSSHRHYDHNNVEALSGDPFVITGPGEYETKGVSVRGINTFHDTTGGKERGTNTAYVITTEGISIAHLGDFGEDALRPEILDALGGNDILMIPVGGVYTIDGKTAARFVKQLEPRVVIPMHYAMPGLKVKLDGPESFLKEMAARGGEKLEKLTIKKKELTELAEKEVTQVILLSPAR